MFWESFKRPVYFSGKLSNRLVVFIHSALNCRYPRENPGEIDMGRRRQTIRLWARANSHWDWVLVYWGDSMMSDARQKEKSKEETEQSPQTQFRLSLFPFVCQVF